MRSLFSARRLEEWLARSVRGVELDQDLRRAVAYMQGWVLEYVNLPSPALREIQRVVLAGGHVVLATPFFHRRDTSHDFWGFTDEGLRFLLGEAGFEVLLLVRQGGALGVVVNVLKHAIYVEPRTWRRRAAGYLLRLIGRIIRRGWRWQ